MSAANDTTGVAKTSVPAWIGAGLIGITLGVGATLIVTRALAESPSPGTPVDSPDSASAGSTAATPPSGPAMMPAGGPMMMGMMGGGPRPKRTLTSTVGKLDLLTRETLHVELDADQKQKISELLAKLEQAESMTDEEAQAHVDAIQALLTPDQKAVLESISLPFGRPGGGGAPGGASGGSSAGGPAGAPGGPPGGGFGGPSDPSENPFRRETDQKRLQELLQRTKA